jgi:putative transposase
MPRQPRLDVPGAVHHVWTRGMGRQSIFLDDDDRLDLLDRLDRSLPSAGVGCFAWALLGNHFHLVLQAGEGGISMPLRGVLTGFALRFNRRHGREGYLFQGRFGSRLAIDDSDLLGLVRYVCLNPIRAGIVRGVRQLERYPWSSYGAMVGRRDHRDFERVDEVLGLFGPGPRGRTRMRDFMRAGLSIDDCPPSRPAEDPSLESLIEAVCSRVGIKRGNLRPGSRTPASIKARALIAHLGTDELGFKARDVAVALDVTQSAVSHARRRGRALLAREGPDLLRNLVKFQVRPRGGR